MNKKSSTPSTDPKTPAPQKELDEATLEAVSGGTGVNVTGTDQDDTLVGSAAADILAGEDGDDTITGGAGEDNIRGGAGNDTIDGGDDNDRIDAGGGDDNIQGGDGNDWIKGNSGDDTIDGGKGNDTILGSWGRDTLRGGDGNDNIKGGEGNYKDTLEGGRGADTLDGEGGDDTIHGGHGNDTILGGDGNDTIRGGYGADTIDGGDDDDDIKGSWGEDNIRGGQGNDTIDGGGQDDWINAGSGDDIVKGGSGDDFIKGNAGHDTLDGGTGDDHITGEWGRDVISGGDGNDVLDGGLNRDTIDGGAGDDRIIIRPGDGQDTIDGGEDRDIIWMEGITPENAEGWTLSFADGHSFTFDMTNGYSYNLAEHGGAGELISPEGKVTTFTNMETLSMPGADTDDTMYAANGDVVRGGEGDDTLMGVRGEGNILDGGDGDDTLITGTGSDDMSGGDGNDHFIVNSMSSNGNDIIRGGDGRDSVLLARTSISDVADWNYQAPNGTLTPLNELMIGQTVDLAALGGEGVLISPSGETITFSEMETLTLELPTVNGEDVVPLEVIPPHVDGTPVATIIGGLPKGVYVAGTAEPPQSAGDGSFFQVVDRDALINGELELVFGPGILQNLNLTVATMTKEGGEIETTSGSFTYQVEPQDSDFASVSHGEMGFENNKSVVGEGHGWVPLDIAINPKIQDGATVDIGGLNAGMVLVNTHGEEFTPTSGKVIGLTAQQAEGLHIRGHATFEETVHYEGYDTKINGVRIVIPSFDFTDGGDADGDGDSAGTHGITVHIEAEFEGEKISIDEQIAVEFPDVELAQGTNADGEKFTSVIGRLSGDRADYEIVRNGNTISVQPNDGGEAQTFSMFDFDAVRFADGMVSFNDFRQEHDISAIFNQLEANDQLEGSTVILVSGIPAGAILDLGANLGNGVWGIPAQAVVDGKLNLDFPSMEAEAETNIAVRATVLSEGDTALFNGLVRVSGFASAEAQAGASANARFAIDGNGVRAGAEANAEVSAVASAGGTYGPYEAQVSASATVSAGASVGVNFSATETEVEGYIGVRAEVKAEGEVNHQMAPGVHSTSTGEVGVAVVAEAGGNGYMQHGKGNYGAGGEGEAAYGAAATAEGYHSQTVGAAQVGGGGGVSAGGQVGAGGGGHAGIQGDTVHFGLSGDVALLVGIKFDFDIAIDVGEVADAAKLVADGVVDAYYAIGSGLTTATDAIEGGLIDAGEAFTSGLLSPLEEVDLGFRVDVGGALTNVGKEAEKVWNDIEKDGGVLNPTNWF